MTRGNHAAGALTTGVGMQMTNQKDLYRRYICALVIKTARR